jgi:cation transporter-like permease
MRYDYKQVMSVCVKNKSTTQQQQQQKELSQISVFLFIILISGGGIILTYALKLYQGIAILQPVVNGVGGNLVSIYASRLSTALHRTSEPGRRSHWAPRRSIHYIPDTFWGKLSIKIKTIIK